jgi:hypothetical protein
MCRVGASARMQWRASRPVDPRVGMYPNSSTNTVFGLQVDGMAASAPCDADSTDGSPP